MATHILVTKRAIDEPNDTTLGSQFPSFSVLQIAAMWVKGPMAKDLEI